MSMDLPHHSYLGGLVQVTLAVRSRNIIDAALGTELQRVERTAFWARVDQSLDGVAEVLHTLYPDADLEALLERILVRAARSTAARQPDLRDLDAKRTIDPGWFQSNEQVGYVAYAERFGGTIDGVRQRLGHLRTLGVTYFHLMHVLRAREGANDGGYAVVDYGQVEPGLGTRADLAVLADELRAAGVSLCLDVVINHTAREHPWAVAARAGSKQHRDYYRVYPDRMVPDLYEATLPEVFPEMAPGSFTFDDELDGWVWTTFHNYQWDLNYANPEVFIEMLDVMFDLANLGVDVLRLDAVAFTWKRIGTNCQNQPEAHLIAQAFRAFVAIAAPAVVLKAEAIVSPEQLVPYLGSHRTSRRECQLAYHNQLMVMLWSTLATGDATLAVESLTALPPTPVDAGWVSYLRCHDDIGWAVDDAAAARTSLNGADHRRFLAEFYRGAVPGSYAEGVAFSSNPDADDERTCGSAAALCGLDAAIQRDDEIAADLAVRRLLLGYAVTFSFAGIPLIYMGDELGLPNDYGYVDDQRFADDSRWVHRPAMPWGRVAQLTESGGPHAQIWQGIRSLAAKRQTLKPLSGGGVTWVHRVQPTSVFAWERRHPVFGRFYGIANFAEHGVSLPATALVWAGLDAPVEVLNAGVEVVDGNIELPALSIGWFVDERDGGVQPRPTTAT
jgi:amylosucrase